MIYADLEQMKEEFPYSYSGNPEDIRLFIRGENPQKRQESCMAVKGLLESMFESEKTKGEIKDYEVRVVDLLTETSRDLTNDCSTFWARMGNKDGKVFVPIFHNAGDYDNLPQMAFDRNVPGIFSLTDNQYWNVRNASKRECYDVLEVE